MVTKEREEEIFTTTCCTAERCPECCVEKTLNVIGGKWNFLVLKHLFSGRKRFGELRRLLHDINTKSLTNALRSLEANGLIHREAFPTVPTTVEYSLTQKGTDLKQIIMDMYMWGEKWLK